MNISVEERLERIEAQLTVLVSQQKTQKEWYSTTELAELTDRAEYTVREWCRLGRITAEKETKGRKREWRVNYDEVQRILNHGPRPLLPQNREPCHHGE